MSDITIPFNRPDVSGNEEKYLKEVLRSGKLSGDGPFSRRCARYFEESLGATKALLTSSCTDALEMCALLLNLGPGDEVIMPSYTFVSTANAFYLRGVDLRFCDSTPEHPNLCLDHLERLISERTKAVVVVHYGGVACDMDRLRDLTEPRGIKIVEDAAHAVDSYYKGRPLGSIGDLATLSFHETKNVVCGEGGLLVVNNPEYAERAEILWEKGTNRSQFFRGEVDKYGWVDVGSSYLGSELSAAVLWAQLERVNELQNSRRETWNRYHELLEPLQSRAGFQLLDVPNYATNNAHLFGLVFDSLNARTDFLGSLRKHGILGTFHYQPLHRSPFFAPKYAGPDLVQADRYGDCLVRLPLFAGMTESERVEVNQRLTEYFDRVCPSCR